MNNFTLTGFSDEISPDINKQFDYLGELGIKYFEVRGVNGTNIADLTLDEAKEVKALADKCGIKTSSIGSPIGKIEITDDFDAHMQLLSHIIDIAKILETTYIRIFSFYIRDGKNPEDYRSEVMRRMSSMTELAAKHNIILLHENEKDIYGDIASRCKDILDTVNSPNLRAVFDPANFIQSGQPVYPEAFDMLAPYIEYVHIKDSTANLNVVPAGYGIGNIQTVLATLKSTGYQGFVSIEPHLGSFAGFDKLESAPLHSKTEDKSGPHTFKMAFDALMDILNKI